MGPLASKGEMRNTHRFLVRKPKILGKLGMNKRRWVENTVLRVGWSFKKWDKEGVKWIHLAKVKATFQAALTW